jgi:hypothetical protein
MDPDGVSGELVAILVAHGEGGTSMEQSFPYDLNLGVP